MKKKWTSIVDAVIGFLSLPKTDMLLVMAIVYVGIATINLIFSPLPKHKPLQSWDNQSLDGMTIEEKQDMFQKLKRINVQLEDTEN